MTELKYIPGVATLEIDHDGCVGCGLCEVVCPHEVIHVEDGKARIFDLDACMECGACQTNCPVAAITVSAGVGCATGIIIGALRGTEPTCGCCKGGNGRSNCC